MSLIYVHKVDGIVRILSDSKIYVDPDYIQQLKHELTENETNNIIKYGMIKTIIYKSNITISSAGHIEVFNELLKQLYEEKIEKVYDISNIALKIHQKHKCTTDFIITTDKEIFCIRNDEIEKSETAWIGDSDAFNKFQQLKMNAPQKTITVITEKGNYEEQDKYSPVYDAFKYIVDNNLFEKVGGMLITCTYRLDIKRFQYNESYAIYTGFNYSKTLKPGERLIYEDNVEDGGFSYYAFNHDKYYAMNINQSDKILIYKPGYSSKNYRYLSLPSFINKN